MKIALIGFFDENPTEGIRNASISIYNELRRNNDVRIYHINDPRVVRYIRKFNPDVIHYLICPTRIGIIYQKIISSLSHINNTVISALQNTLTVSDKWAELFRPTILLAQSFESENIFKKLNFDVKTMPNGVNISKFLPVNDNNYKSFLRKKYGIKKQDYVILHMASIKKGRNLDVVKYIINKLDSDVKFLIIGRPTENYDKCIYRELIDNGCIIKKEYFSNVHELYNLSDCYFFPTIDKHFAIEMPLSVLEAMSCNLPVISSQFMALPRFLKQGNGLFYYKEDDQILSIIDEIRNGLISNTRQRILCYSWNNIIKKMEEIYNDINH